MFRLIVFFVFGEEISWEQRILNFETPIAIEELNVQGEFNLHKMKFFHGKTMEGVKKEGIRKLITMRRLFYITFITYLLIFPVMYKFNLGFKTIIHNKVRLPIPSIYFEFAFSKFIRQNYGEIVENEIKITSEIKEMLFSLILLIMALPWFNFIKRRGEKSIQ
ncbi:hypothetical protein [Pareuzebyella sediminis]|uniref:hypothetical protein n=1 Tax=Pareuzebyella sediminis TaxID=2607998 RepID=UPI0011EE4511|nr:hypothetical protein [Pareuzebyella sediminis]